MAIPYGKIQNVDVVRGILARLFNLADIRIQTAGQSNPYTVAEGHLPGLSRDEAEKLRDELIKREK